jgi:two-component system, sensor histidine kinase
MIAAPSIAPLLSPLGAVIAASSYSTGASSSSPAQFVLHADDETNTAASKPRALVVDDAPDVTEMIGLLLKLAGYEATTAYSGAQALAAARAAQFDVLISDIGMPGMNGYELAEQLRALSGYEHVPMIAVTGFTMYDDRDRALASGFNAFLTKPIRPNDLLTMLEKLRG